MEFASTLTLDAAFAKYVEVLLHQWLWDVSYLSEPWMYYWLLVPVTCFVMFMMTKWAVLTAPIWVPITIICVNLRKCVGRRA